MSEKKFSADFAKEAVGKFRNIIGIDNLPSKERQKELLEEPIFKPKVNLVSAEAFDENGFYKSGHTEVPVMDASLDGRRWFRQLMDKHDFEIALNKMIEVYKKSLETDRLSHTDIRNLTSYIEMQILLKEDYISKNEYNVYAGIAK